MGSQTSNPVIVLKAYEREELLSKCIESLLDCRSIGNFKIVVIQQSGSESVTKLLEKHSSKIHTLVSTSPSGISVDSYITNNMVLGYWIGFEFWRADYVLSIEEDVVLAYDALEFTLKMFDKYKNDSKFRGVNLGSKLRYNSERRNTYTKTRFGIHGPAGMITRMTWNRINKYRILKNADIIFDAQMEFALKSGFMIAPNCSRYIDNGTKSSRVDNDFIQESYFKGLRESFASGNSEPKEYIHRNEEPAWRSDCRIYKRKGNWFHLMREKLYPIVLTELGRKYLNYRHLKGIPG